MYISKVFFGMGSHLDEAGRFCSVLTALAWLLALTLRAQGPPRGHDCPLATYPKATNRLLQGIWLETAAEAL